MRIFERLSQIIVTSANLFEAETDRLLEKIFILTGSILLLFVATVSFCVGLYFLLCPLYISLQQAMGILAAQIITGIILCLVGGGTLWQAQKRLK